MRTGSHRHECAAEGWWIYGRIGSRRQAPLQNWVGLLLEVKEKAPGESHNPKAWVLPPEKAQNLATADAPEGDGGQNNGDQ